MDSPMESYKNGNYKQVLQLLNSYPNKLIECKTLLKLTQMKSPISMGSCISKSCSDILQKVISKIKISYQEGQMNKSSILGFDNQNFKNMKKHLNYSISKRSGNKDDQIHKLLLITECYINLNQYQKAIKTLEHASENSYCYALLSEYYFKLDQQQQELQWMKDALKINQNYYYALNNQAKNENIDQQIIVITQFLEKDPNNFRLIREHINILIISGRICIQTKGRVYEQLIRLC